MQKFAEDEQLEQMNQ
jgi:hypothetical protein